MFYKWAYNLANSMHIHQAPSPILVISVLRVCSQGSKEEGVEDISRHMELNILISQVLGFLELGIKTQEKKTSKDKEALY